jgi:hypothetical protein
MIRRQCLYGLLALAGGVLGGLASGKISSTAGATLAQSQLRSMAAQEIILVDAKGQRRGALILNKDGDPSLSLYDHQGTLRSALDLSNADGLGFKLFDASGALRISLMINTDQIPAIRLFDSHHRPRTLLGVDPEGEAALDFYSEEGKLLRELP